MLKVTELVISGKLIQNLKFSELFGHTWMHADN